MCHSHALASLLPSFGSGRDGSGQDVSGVPDETMAAPSAQLGKQSVPLAQAAVKLPRLLSGEAVE